MERTTGILLSSHLDLLLNTVRNKEAEVPPRRAQGTGKASETSWSYSAPCQQYQGPVLVTQELLTALPEVLGRVDSQVEMLELMVSSFVWMVGLLPGLISPAGLSTLPVLLLPFSLRKVLGLDNHKQHVWGYRATISCTASGWNQALRSLF